MQLKILKFDTINPQGFIQDKIDKNKAAIDKMSRSEVLAWIISTRANFSDFYTYNLQKLGWHAEEFVVFPYYVEKVADELYGGSKSLRKMFESMKNKIRPKDNRWYIQVMSDYISSYKPDVILVREKTGIRSEFWRNFGKRSLIVSRLAAPIPRQWTPSDFDLILTSTESYKSFFELNGVQSYINQNGFDKRILSELGNGEKKFDVTFVGGLGNRYWLERTKCAEYLAGQIDFKWWGYNGNRTGNPNLLKKSWQGLTSGIDMLRIYKQSKIVFNDYGEVADKSAVNQRIFEVLGVGSLLLTRDAENLKREFPADIFVTFRDEKDCLDKAKYFLKNEKEREEIAARGQKHVIENFSYDRLMAELDTVLREHYNKKFPNSHQ